MQYIKQSTATTVMVGPFLDKDDGVTPEIGLAAGTVDEIGVYKHEAIALTDISGTTAFTHRAGGMYTTTLSNTDTNTLGRMRLYVRDDSVCLPVWEDFMVMPANVFDSLVSTDYLQVDIAQISSDAAAANNLELMYDGTGYPTAENAIADATLIRGVSNTENAADATSLTALILAAFESSIAGVTWSIRKTGGAAFTSKTVTKDAAATPIIGVT